jgi:phosphatidylglycerol:prolipoprotein diacylglycerol transferase
MIIFMFIYPHINPVAFKLGPLQVHWYGLMYIVGFLSGWGLGHLRSKRPDSPVTSEQVGDLIFWCAIGVVVGGRIGYMLFYDFQNFIQDPLLLFQIWKGGMSFHGGFIGVILALWLYSRHIKQPFFAVGDFFAPLVPIGLAAGRIGNFINGELWGRVTNVPWAMIYPQAGPEPRHPSQIYEFLMEGILLFIIMWFFSSKPRPRMAVSGLFILCYGIFRTIAECFRAPDPQIGFIAFGWLTKGQLLSFPMIILGLIFLHCAYRWHARKLSHVQ